jgi:hypothetical protein
MCTGRPGVLVVVLAGMALLSGCISQLELQTSFSPEAAAACDGTGTGSITGRASPKTMIGEVRYPGGEEVQLIRSTPYTQEILFLMLSGSQPTNIDSRLFRYMRTTQADAAGEFEFTGLPPCTYIVSTKVYWIEPSSYCNGRESCFWRTSVQGGILAKEVRVNAGQAVDVILTR